MTVDDKWEAGVAPAARLATSFNRKILESLEEGPGAAAAFAFPLNGTRRAYRGWYHVPGGTQSRWCPRQSRYKGPRPGGEHAGLDLWSHESSKIVAVAGGTIEYNPRNDPTGWGEHIYLYFKHAGATYIAVYAHLHPDSKFPGTKAVQMGQEIGIPGCSGNAGAGGKCHRAYKCSGKTAIEDHLHFELLKPDGTRMDPVAFFGFANIEHANDETCALCGSGHQLD